MSRRRPLSNVPSSERVRPLTFWQRGWLKLVRTGRAGWRWLGRLPRWLRVSVLGVITLCLSLLALDRIFPPPPLDPAYARVVLDMKGRPLRAFADTSGVWRYPVTLEDRKSVV